MTKKQLLRKVKEDIEIKKIAQEWVHFKPTKNNPTPATKFHSKLHGRINKNATKLIKLVEKEFK